MKVVMTKYKLLDGKEHILLKAIGNGRVIRLFNKTPYPEKPTDVVCPHFHELVCFYGCPYDCEWCYLKGTFRFIQRDNGRIPVRFKKERDIINSIKAFLQASALGQIPPTILNTGELADSLCSETPVFYRKPFSEYIMPYFEETKHKILFLSKGTNVSNFLKHEWQRNAILSWTINAYPVARRWETLAPHPKKRIRAARQVAGACYEVRIRIDPMVAVEGFEKHYKKLVIDLLDDVTPSRITLGCLRGLTSTIARARDKSWVNYLAERSSWGRKPSIETRFRLYRNVIDSLREHGYTGEIGVCKDTLKIWKMMKKQYGLEHQKIRCNCNW
jgi:spore photoproduct lyase